MQEDCEEIYPAVLYNIMYGDRVRREISNMDTPVCAQFYGPETHHHDGKLNMIFLVMLQKLNVLKAKGVELLRWSQWTAIKCKVLLMHG